MRNVISISYHVSVYRKYIGLYLFYSNINRGVKWVNVSLHDYYTLIQAVFPVFCMGADKSCCLPLTPFTKRGSLWLEKQCFFHFALALLIISGSSGSADLQMHCSLGLQRKAEGLGLLSSSQTHQAEGNACSATAPCCLLEEASDKIFSDAASCTGLPEQNTSLTSWRRS